MSTSTTAKTALVVDDSKSARFALRRCLEGHGYHVETAGSAEEAYEFLASSIPQLMFLDHLMPGADGFEALQTVKADPRLRHIPVVLCSSSDSVAFASDAQARGAAAAMQKPPHPEQLRVLLQRLERDEQRSTQLAAAQTTRGVALPVAVGAEFAAGPARNERPVTPPPPVRPPASASDDAVVRSLRSVFATEGPAANAGSDDLHRRQLARLGEELRREIEDLRRLLAQPPAMAAPAATADGDTALAMAAALEARLTQLERRVAEDTQALQARVDAQLAQQAAVIQAAAVSAATAAAERAAEAALQGFSQRIVAALSGHPGAGG